MPSTPQFVLNNLMKAYADRDSTHYKDCYDRTYVGQSYDGFDTNGYQPASYSFDDEAMHIAALQRSTTIYHVSFDLPNYMGAPRENYPADPAGWTTIRIQNPSVQIDDQANSSVIITGEVFQYKFIPTTPVPSSPTDTLWKIVQWTEIAPSGL